MSRLWRVAAVDARLDAFCWDWPELNRDAVAADWTARLSARPGIFDGRVLMACGLEEHGERIRASFFETSYASMLAWLGAGPQGAPVWNGFAMGALRCRDGGFLLGRMADHTANAGRLYFPCGTPDLSDVTPDGRVDLEGSIRREIAEETGLGPDSYELDPGWVVAEQGGYLAFLRSGRLHLDEAETRARIGRHLAAETRPELAAVEIIRRPEEAEDDAIPGVVAMFLRDAFGRQG